MASPLLLPLLILLLSVGLGADEQQVQDTGERIINGASCPRRSRPWQVALFEGNVFRCAGVLIDEQWVLTVAHCHMSEYTVHLGSDLLVGWNAQRIRATVAFIHPNFEDATWVHNIMLVKLSRPATLSSTVNKVDLPLTCSQPGSSCTVSGWGSISQDVVKYPSKLMCSNVKLITFKQCRSVYPTMLGRDMICAAPPDRHSYACKGDSGSPLMCHGSLQGLVASDYFPCPAPFDPITYTRVCKYTKWIKETMKNNS